MASLSPAVSVVMTVWRTPPLRVGARDEDDDDVRADEP